MAFIWRNVINDILDMALLTLLSDLGYSDASAGIARGLLSQYVTPHHIVDISHDIDPFQLQQAAYILGAAYKSFPAGTMHLLMLDIYKGTNPRLILSKHNDHYFLCADNGLLPHALGTTPDASWLVLELTAAHTFADWLKAAGGIAQHLATNTAPQLPRYTLAGNTAPPQRIASSIIDCNILHTDHYENVVTDVTKDDFATLAAGRPFRLEFTQVEELATLSDDYRDVRAGYKLCRFNSNGYLEICINRGRAASLFGLKKGSINNNIKLIFE